MNWDTMNNPEFNDIGYWHQKAQNLESLLDDCHEMLGDNRSILTICNELKYYKNLVEGGRFATELSPHDNAADYVKTTYSEQMQDD